ncbi:MAG: hypothetical protein AAF495_14195 [Pseudomonadota bacterium]
MKRQAELEQLPEILYIKGVLHTLYTTPLLPWLRTLDSKSVFDQRTPTCKRGYVGKWEIRDDTLWLIGLYAWRDGQYTGVAEMFDDLEEVEADWFTGPLIVEPASSEIPDGALPKVTTMMVEAGRIVQPEARTDH